jgi:Kef-type K+ transport system membrane component KefB
VRRIAILALLFLLMQFILPLQEDIHAGARQTLLVFGFLMLAAYTVGELSTLVSLPRITGYLFAGMLFGPSVLGTVSPAVVSDLAPVNRLAIALIAFLAGAELRWSELRDRARTIVTMLGAEILLSFLAIAGVLVALAPYVPFLAGGTMLAVVALSMLFAAVAVVHSPAVMMALLTETGARGPVARTTLGIVLVADVVVVLAFSAVLAIVRALVPAPGGGGGMSAGMIAWEIGGAVLVGAALGVAIALYLRFVQRELLMFAVVIAFFGSEIARLAHVETLLTLLVAGFVTENVAKRGGAELLHAMERSAAPVFVVFFALAGATIALGELVSLWPIALVVVVVRAAAVWGGCRLGARWSPTSDVEQRYIWMGLIAQAGVAIGLVAVIAQAYPERGAQMQTLLLAVIAINQLIGPVMARYALVRSGEVAVQPSGEAHAAAAHR